MKFSLPALLLIMIAMTNCDRYSSPVGNQDTSFRDKLNSYTAQLEESLITAEMQPVRDYYADNYLNNGQTKESVHIFLSDIAAYSPDSLYIYVHSVDQNNLTFSYDLIAYKSVQDSVATIIDTTIVEYTLGKDEDYLFIGNRESLADSPYKKVLVEVFTGTDCINCIYVKTALNRIKRELGNQFYYLEYHQRNELDFGNADIYSYYGVRSIPTGIIQGSTRIRGSSGIDISYTEYKHVITSHLNEAVRFNLSDFSYIVRQDSISFEITVVDVDHSENGWPERFQLKYALIEKETTALYYDNSPLHNVTIAKGLTALENTDRQVIKISFPKPDFSFNKPALLIWLQTIPLPYNADNSRVQNVYEQRIIIPE